MYTDVRRRNVGDGSLPAFHLVPLTGCETRSPRMRSCYLLKLVSLSVIKCFPRLKTKIPSMSNPYLQTTLPCEDLNEIQTDCRQGRLHYDLQHNNKIILMEYPRNLIISELKCYHSTDLYTSIKY